LIFPVIVIAFCVGIFLGFSIHTCQEIKKCDDFSNQTPSVNVTERTPATPEMTLVKPLSDTDKVFIESLLRNDEHIASVLGSLKEYISKGDPSIIIAADRLNDLTESAEKELSPLPVSDNLAEIKVAYLSSLSSMRKGSLDIVVATNSFMHGEQNDFEFYLNRGSNTMKNAEDTRNYVLNSINYTLESTKPPIFQFIEISKDKIKSSSDQSSNNLNLTSNVTNSVNKTCNGTLEYKNNQKFVVNYPCNWLVFPGKKANTDQVELINPSDATQIIIASIIGQFDHSLDDFQQSRLMQLAGEKKDFKIKSKSSLKLGGQTAYNIIYSYNEDGVPMTGGDILIKKDKTFYGLVFSFTDKSFSEDQKNIESIVNSFNFK